MFLKSDVNVQIPKNPEELVGANGARFLEKLKDEKYWAKIPLLNYTPLHKMKDMDVVRFRGMIQDMQNPEIYLERYQVNNSNGSTGTRIQNNKYRDCSSLKAGEEINYDSAANAYGERRTLFVVSLPGINTWTLEYEQQCNQRHLTGTTGVNKEGTTEGATKRAAPSGSEISEDMEIDIQSQAGASVSNDSNKRQRKQNHETTSTPATCTLGTEYLLNSPIPERPSKACMIKVYENFDSYALNSIIDVVGFLSVNPMLDASTIDTEMSEDFENASELQAQNPPPSLIPRIHAIAVHNIAHANPLLDMRFVTSSMQPEADIDMVSVHKEMRTMLSLCLFNDELAADYLLSHLISTVYSRCEMQCIGKLALNICNLPQESLTSYTNKLYEILELLLPVSHYLPMTLDVMNTANFTPKKDYNTNKLVSGLLQLAPHTHLVLDETRLEQGRLEVNGVLGVQSLANLINRQQIKCNFQYYEIDYDTDIPVLVLSEGRSMLPNDFTVPLHTDSESVQLIAETLKAAHHYLQQSTRLNQFRRFLTIAKTTDFTMDPEHSEMVQTDFVEMRKANTLTTSEDLHALLVLSRLLAIARGKSKLDRESWELAKDMEARRKQRLTELPNSKRLLHIQ